jgi:hypothetical protein
VSRGKKIGKLVVTLDRVVEKVRWGGYGDRHAEFVVDLRFDFHTGDFHVEHEGNWYSAKTKEALEAKIKKAVERTIDLVWDRYIVVQYEMTAKPLESTNAPSLSTGNVFGISDDRDDLIERWRRKKIIKVVAGIELAWDLVDYTRPWIRPESGKSIRCKRTVDYYEDDAGKHVERLGDPCELDSDELPTGAVLWSKEREQLLHDILKMLAELDRRMVELFRGDAEALAGKLDVLSFDPQRLLAAPPADLKTVDLKPAKREKRKHS